MLLIHQVCFRVWRMLLLVGCVYLWQHLNFVFEFSFDRDLFKTALMPTGFFENKTGKKLCFKKYLCRRRFGLQHLTEASAPLAALKVVANKNIRSVWSDETATFLKLLHETYTKLSTYNYQQLMLSSLWENYCIFLEKSHQDTYLSLY